MSHLVQILLPKDDNQGHPYDLSVFQTVQSRLAGRFGGVTAYSRAPAEGVWAHDGTHEHDDIVVMEVMVETLDRAWWSTFRRELETTLRQHQIVMRAHLIEIL